MRRCGSTSRVRVENASLSYRDQQSGQTVQVSGLQLRTGRIASGVPGKLEFSAKVRSDKPALDAIGNHVLPAAGLDVHFLPGQPDHADQEALGQPVLAHHPHGQSAAGPGERQLAVALDPQQAVAFHPGHGLAHGRAAL